MVDITIIYMTANRMPQRWVKFHRRHLLAAITGLPTVLVVPEGTGEELDLGIGEKKLYQDLPWGGWSTFCMWNRAAKLAETEFVAIAEDDSLYHPEHFIDFRPRHDEIAYDMSRWTVMSWHREPRYSMIRRLGGFMMVAPTQLVIEALDEREAKFPRGFHRPGEIGREDSELRMGVTRRKHVEWYCKFPTINLAHTEGVSPTYIGPTKRKRKEGEIKAYDIPYWGRAADIADVFNKGMEEEGRGGTLRYTA